MIEIAEVESATGEGIAAGAAEEGLPQAPDAQDSGPGTQHLESEIERLKAELAEAQTRGLEAYRRALLAENSGRIVPEMVMGATAEEMERSLGAAREAFEAAKAAAMAEMATTQVPAGNPIRQGPGIETMSPLEKIAYGLKRD